MRRYPLHCEAQRLAKATLGIHWRIIWNVQFGPPSEHTPLYTLPLTLVTRNPKSPSLHVKFSSEMKGPVAVVAPTMPVVLTQPRLSVHCAESVWNALVAGTG